MTLQNGAKNYKNRQADSLLKKITCRCNGINDEAVLKYLFFQYFKARWFHEKITQKANLRRYRILYIVNYSIIST